jgi:predicted NBD/HSP70 family sugar kinase
MLQDHAFRPEKLVGIGISSPGPLDLSAGRILEPIDYALFCNFDVVREVSSWILDPADGRSVAAYRLPVSLENMAVLMGVREFYKENSKLARYRQILYVTVSQGVGSCIINDGQIYRGFGGYAGELGHTSIDGAGRPCSCGNFGCLERYVTLPAICDFFNLESYEVLIDQAFTGQARSLAILEQISDWLTTALVNAVNLFDVDAIVLYGEISYRPQLLTEFLQKRIS